MMRTKKGKELEARLTRNYYLPFEQRMQVQGVCSLILRHAATLQRLAETACNRELTADEEKKDGSLSARVTLLVEDLKKLGCKNVVGVNFSGDPRGVVVKIKVNDHVGDSWGGSEWVCCL